MTDCNVSFSICIPCYNDLEGLRQTIGSILSQVETNQTDQVQIVVGLNDCGFEESDILKEQTLNSCTVVKVFKTSKYLEYNESIQFVLSNVKTEFCLLLGCGEIALTNFFSALFSFGASKTDFGLVPVGLKRQDENSTKLVPESEWLPSRLGVFNKILSGHVFRTESLQCLSNDLPLIAPEWAHVELALAVQGNCSTGSVTYGSPAILRQKSEKGWWSKTDIFKQYIEYCDLLLAYNERYPHLEYVKYELEKAYSIRLFLMILQVKSNGLREVPLFFSDWISRYCEGRVHRFVMKCALRTPEKIASKLMKLANWKIGRN